MMTAHHPAVRDNQIQREMRDALARINRAVARSEALRDELCSVAEDIRATIARLETERGAQQ